MESTGFFTIHISAPGQEHAPKVEAPDSSGELDRAGAAASGYSVRLEWIQGEPYLTDLGSAGKVLVNATPVEPNRPVAIEAGDSITIGNVHLTWNAETGADQPSQEPKVTLVLPPEPASPPGKSD